MVIASLIKEKLSSTPAGVVLTTRDFGVEMRYQPALAKALNRLVHQGELQKIAKGKYYIPKIYLSWQYPKKPRKSLLYQWFSSLEWRLLHHNYTICERALM